jgi:hypothetical protein
VALITRTQVIRTPVADVFASVIDAGSPTAVALQNHLDAGNREGGRG